VARSEATAVTTKTSSHASVGLKKQVYVALAGAIGLMAGIVLWHAMFIGLRGIDGWILASWSHSPLIAAAVTLAWARGVFHGPRQAARFGALTGVIVGSVLELLSAQALSSRSAADQIDVTFLTMIEWGFYGFFGGLAIEKKWATRPVFGVAVGVGVAAVVMTCPQAVYVQSVDPQPGAFADPLFWTYTLSRQLLPALGWAVGIFLWPGSDHALMRRDESADSLSETDLAKTSHVARVGFWARFETAFTATVGVAAGMLVWHALQSGTLAWNGATLGFLLAIGFSVFLNVRYMDPFFERVRGESAEAPASPSRLRKVSLLSVAATVPVAIFMQLNDKLLTDNPAGAALWAVAAVSAGAITLAWAHGMRRSPSRAAEFGALAGVFVVGLSYLAINAVAIWMCKRGVEEAVARVIVATLEWGLYGLLGGLAIERIVRGGLAMRVGLGLGVAGLVVATSLMVAGHGLLGSDPEKWLAGLGRVFFIALGWAWGITLFHKADDVFRARQRHPERSVVPQEASTRMTSPG
jgi:hypothetical protein